MRGYGSHPYGTLKKRDIARKKSMAPSWRTRGTDAEHAAAAALIAASLA